MTLSINRENNPISRKLKIDYWNFPDSFSSPVREKVHYVYMITNTKKNKHYIGVRSAEHPDKDLGIKYLSSSKDENFINDQKANPENYRYEIINQYFETREDAVSAEHALLTLLDVKNNLDYYNRSNGDHDFSFEERSNGGRIRGRKDRLIGSRKGYANGLANLTPEERSEYGRKGALAAAETQGKHVWSLEEIADIHDFREESIGKGFKKTCPSWGYITSEMNEKYGENYTTNQVKKAYHINKDLLPD